jgi:serine/threonine protein phosphatase PrpC
MNQENLKSSLSIHIQNLKKIKEATQNTSIQNIYNFTLTIFTYIANLTDLTDIDVEKLNKVNRSFFSTLPASFLDYNTNYKNESTPQELFSYNLDFLIAKLNIVRDEYAHILHVHGASRPVLQASGATGPGHLSPAADSPIKAKETKSAEAPEAPDLIAALATKEAAGEPVRRPVSHVGQTSDGVGLGGLSVDASTKAWETKPAEAPEAPDLIAAPASKEAAGEPEPVRSATSQVDQVNVAIGPGHLGPAADSSIKATEMKPVKAPEAPDLIAAPASKEAAGEPEPVRRLVNQADQASGDAVLGGLSQPDDSSIKTKELAATANAAVSVVATAAKEAVGEPELVKRESSLPPADSGAGLSAQSSASPEAKLPGSTSAVSTCPGDDGETVLPAPPGKPGEAAKSTADQPKSQLPPLTSYENTGRPLIALGIQANATGNSQKIFEEISRIIQQLPPILGKFDQKFEFMLDIEVHNSFKVKETISNHFITDKLGLRADFRIENSRGILTIQGRPKSGYDGQIEFQITILNSSNGGIKRIFKDFYIASDPKSLWKDLKVEDYEGYETKNEDSQFLEIPNINKSVIAASCRGRSHAHVGSPRDDNFAFSSDNVSGWNFFAVADGAGSAKYSRKGSEIACNLSTSHLKSLLDVNNFYDNLDISNLIKWKEYFDNTFLNKKYNENNEFRHKFNFDQFIYATIYAIYTRIHEEAKAKQELILKDKVTIRDYHTTLLFMVIKKFDFGYLMISYWVGDGAPVIYNLNNSNKVLLLGKPDTGEYAGQTKFLTMKEEINPKTVFGRTYYRFADDFESIILVTDGITDPFFPSEASLASEDIWRNFWTKILQEGDDENPGCPQLFDKNTSCDLKKDSLLKWLNFWSKGNHDDRTILIIK